MSYLRTQDRPGDFVVWFMLGMVTLGIYPVWWIFWNLIALYRGTCYGGAAAAGGVSLRRTTALESDALESDPALKSNVSVLEARMGAEITMLELRLVRWIVGTGLAVAGLVVAALLLLG